MKQRIEFNPNDPPPVVACPDGLYRLQGTDWVLITWDDNPRRGCFARDLSRQTGIEGSMEVMVIYYDVDYALDANAEFEKASQGKKMGDWVRYASVPEPIVQMHELNEKMAQGDDKALSRFFNDSDNKKFRTHWGKF